jgi:RHO1 GDP-GTP exchange protein 1/2
MEHINKRSSALATLSSRLGRKSQRSDWFRTYSELFLPFETYNIVFLDTYIAILHAHGFVTTNLINFKNVTIPLRDDSRLEKLWKLRGSSRPVNMFQLNAVEFLLCYDGFCFYLL